MMLVKTNLKESPIAGIGLFASEFIPQGTIVWEFNPKIDILYTKEEIEALPVAAREQIEKYTYLDEGYKKYLLCGDDARFFNHSDSPNCADLPAHALVDVTIAAKDILPGEELTCNYKVFYGNLNEHSEIE